MRVSLRDDTGGPVPDLTGRTAYRVVQEALTNARKHAPGAEVHVHLAGSPGQGLTVEVGNEPPGPAPRPRLTRPRRCRVPGGGRSPTASSGPAGVHRPAAGQGLVGLAERVALASGRLEYGPAVGGGWCLRVWLPWPP